MHKSQAPPPGTQGKASSRSMAGHRPEAQLPDSVGVQQRYRRQYCTQYCQYCTQYCQ